MKSESLDNLAKLSQQLKAQGKTVGLVVGSFDVLHLGHLNLFRLAKKHVDILFVGLDHDQTITLVKGVNRPINDFQLRSEFLNDIATVDKVFLIEKVSMHGSEESLSGYTEILAMLKPTHIFTHKVCDWHWKEKVKIAQQNGIICILDESEKITNSGTIINKLKY